MPERTKRGEEDRKREDEEMTGEPVDVNETATAGTRAANTTKDKSVEPARDNRGDGRGSDKKS
jgi:hypothetical protein